MYYNLVRKILTNLKKQKNRFLSVDDDKYHVLEKRGKSPFKKRRKTSFINEVKHLFGMMGLYSKEQMMNQGVEREGN